MDKEITLEELKSLIKDGIDDTKINNLNILSKYTIPVLLAIIGVIFYQWEDIYEEINNIIPLFFSLLVISYPIFIILYWYEERDYVLNRETKKISTFFVLPFIWHHITHIVIYLICFIILSMIAIYTTWPLLIYSITIVIFEFYLAYRKEKEKKEILPIPGIMIFLFLVASLFFLFHFISFLKIFTIDLVKLVSSLYGLFFFAYLILFKIWTSPKRRIYEKYRECKNRLNSRSDINIPDEVEYFYKTTKGYTFSELFADDLNLLFRSNEVLKIKEEELFNKLNEYDFLSTEQKQKEIIHIKKNADIILEIDDISTNIYERLQNKINQDVKLLSKSSLEDIKECQKVEDLITRYLEDTITNNSYLKTLLSIVIAKQKDLIKETKEHQCIFAPIMDLLGKKWCHKVSNYPKLIQSIIIKICSLINKFRNRNF